MWRLRIYNDKQHSQMFDRTQMCFLVRLYVLLLLFCLGNIYSDSGPRDSDSMYIYIYQTMLIRFVLCVNVYVQFICYSATDCVFRASIQNSSIMWKVDESAWNLCCTEIHNFTQYNSLVGFEFFSYNCLLLLLLFDEK